MAIAVSLCTRCCFGENALISRCLRNHKVICLSGSTQALIAAASLVSSIACFYLAIKNPENDLAKLQLTIGGVGIVLMVLSICGCLYITDFRRVLIEGALRKTVGEAGQEIAREARNVNHDVLQFVNAQKVITSNVNSLEGHVKVSNLKMTDLAVEVRAAQTEDGKYTKTKEELEREITELSSQVQNLTGNLNRIESLHREALESRQQTLDRLRRIEENIVQKEDFVLINIETLTKGSLDAARLSDIEQEITYYGEEDPDGYLNLLDRFPSLNFK